MQMLNNKKTNIELARSLAYYDKTIALLRCGVADETFERLAELLRENGWLVYEVEPETFKTKGGEQIGSITVICDGAAFPEDMSESLERYLMQNGRVFIFGGPLFGNTDITKNAMLLEGVSPLYKVYREEDCDSFETLPQAVTNAKLNGHADYVICPNARPNGEGFGMNRRCRMLPIVSIKKDGGRDDGRRGYAAFFILSDTIGHLVATSGTRLGNVSPITQGSEAAIIGIPLDTVLNMDGEGLIVDMMHSLDNGIFLFEAGTEHYVSTPGEKIKVGAKILSAARDFIDVTVRFKLNGVVKEQTVLTTGQNYTNVYDEFEGLTEGEYIVETELLLDGRVIDCVSEELFVTNGRHSDDKNDYVQVVDGDFILNGEKWYMFGMNYFPLYQVSFELNDYWRGAFDKSNYIPSEVEKDLRHMKQCGINTVAIRVDCNSFENVVDPMRDFFARCARLDMKVTMSFCNITNPLYFNEKAFAVLMEKLDITDDPTLMAHDIFWESGGVFVHMPKNFIDDWKRWLIDQYGSYEAAEESFGVPLDRNAADCIICPPTRYYFQRDMQQKLKLTAYTRFLFDMVSRKWNDAITAMKKYDNNHLYTNRIGCVDEGTPNVFLSAVSKHFDYISLEAYTQTLDEYGYLESATIDRAAHYVSGGKPITWGEYGISLPGMSGLAVGMKLLWDGERNRPLDWRLEEQRQYQDQFNRVFKFCNTKGSMPWFYAGGFRFTEHSDCGYAAPNGTDRPAMEEYASIGDWFKSERQDKREIEYVEVDPEGELSNWGRFVYGDGVFNKFAFDRAKLLEGRELEDTRKPGLGIQAAKRANESDRFFAFKTPGDGTTSADTPLILCGDAEYKGKGPLKYLNGEFNSVKLISGDKVYSAVNGQKLKLPAGKYKVEASVGNLAAAKWLMGDTFGCTAVKCGEVYLHLESDMPYLSNGTAVGELEVTKSAAIEMRLTSIGRAAFGEIFRLVLEVI